MAELKTAFGGQTPKPKIENMDPEVDELIANANRLIHSVYRDTSLNSSIGSSPEPETIAIVPNNQRRSTNITSPTRRQIEIDRINRFCESLDVDGNTATEERHLDRETSRRSHSPVNVSINIQEEVRLFESSRLSTITEIPDVTPAVQSNHQVETPPSVSSNARRSRERTMSTTGNADVIDLSNLSESFHTAVTPVASRVTHTYDDDDDDVIIVSSNLNGFVDLCTPVRTTAVQRSSNVATNRRRQAETSVQLPPAVANSINASVAEVPKRQRQASSSAKTTTSEPTAVPPALKNAKVAASGSSTSESTVLMCPVCMDSAVKHKPTTTKCGHVFCEKCIQQAIKLTHKCPMCNTKLSNRMLFRIYL